MRGRAGVAAAWLRGSEGATTTSNLIILAGSAIAGIVTARALGPAGAGQLAVAAMWPALIHTVGSLGLQSSCSYHFARWPSRRAALVRWLRITSTLQAIVMTAASVGILYVFWLDLRISLPLVFEYSTWAAAATFSLYGACCAQGARNFSLFNAIRIIPSAGPAVLLLAGVATLRLTIAEAGAASVIPVWLSALLAVKWLQATGKSAHAERLSRDERLSVISYGWRSVASLTGLMFNSSADRLTLGLLVPASSLGIYSAAATASSPLPSLTTSIGMVRLPAVAALTGKAKSMAARQAILRSIGVLLLVSPALALVLPWVIPFVYGARYSPAVVPAEILLLGTVFSSLAAVTDDMLRAHGHPGFVTVSQGVGGAITVIGTLLVGRHSLSGVAVVSSLGYALAFTLALVRLRAAAAPPTRAGIRRSREPYLARSSSESPEKTEGHSTMRN